MESRNPTPYPDPPTTAALNDARRELELQQNSLVALNKRIDAAEIALNQIVADSQCAINQMQRERLELEVQLSRTMAYIAPIRRLPNEILRHIFTLNFEDYPCCAWVLAAVRYLQSNY